MTKDPYILLSYLNLKLRDYYDSLELLVDDLNLNKDEIINTLKTIAYFYDEKENQFKNKE